MTLDELQNKIIEIAFNDLSTRKNHTIQIDNALKVITTLHEMTVKKDLEGIYSEFGKIKEEI